MFGRAVRGGRLGCGDGRRVLVGAAVQRLQPGDRGGRQGEGEQHVSRMRARHRRGLRVQAHAGFSDTWGGVRDTALQEPLLQQSVEMYVHIMSTDEATPALTQDQTLTRVNSPATLSIGDLAERTGVKPATLRMWESRHGFPRAERSESGHRRYSETDVELVQQILRRQDAGARLEVAIGELAVLQAGVDDAPSAPSVYAVLRRRHPTLVPQRLKKSTLIALSRAIEDECCVRAEKPAVFGAFQHERYFRAAEERWSELARIARSAIAFAEVPSGAEPGGPVSLVHLPSDAPMRREWAVVCDAKGFPSMLTGWELPGQSAVPDRERLFEAIWTVDPRAVRDAARLCAQVAVQLGHHDAGPLLYELAENPPAPPAELLDAVGLLNRVVAYVDAIGSSD